MVGLEKEGAEEGVLLNHITVSRKSYCVVLLFRLRMWYLDKGVRLKVVICIKGF